VSTQTDIANVCMQLLGAARIAPGALFTALTKNAKEAASCYDELRLAELRRNPWVFATRKVALRPINIGFQPRTLNQQGTAQYPTLLINPALWVSTQTYPVGAIVQYQALYYINTQYANIGLQPDINSNAWNIYFGPLTVSPYDTTGKTGYYPGELVYDPFVYPTKVYFSLVNQPINPNGSPIAPTAGTPAWASTAQYNQGDSVIKSAITYISNVPLNINNDPASTPPGWLIGTTYAATNTVVASDNNVYSSILGGNIGHNPVGDNGVHWTFVRPSFWVISPSLSIWQNGSWLYISDANVTQLNIQYPLGSGPVWDMNTKNVFALPAGFLCEAKDQKVPRWSNDWEFENGYIVASNLGPIIFRFIADIRDTTQFDPMFVYGLGTRMAEHLCETLTNSLSKKATAAQDYEKFMKEARLKNAIESGFTLEDEDSWVQVKISGAYSPYQFP
jgi:hypothetical protein